MFQSRCRDWVVGELKLELDTGALDRSFSLVAEIGWLASKGRCAYTFDS